MIGINKTVLYNGKLYTVVSAETCDRWWILRETLDEPILVDETELAEM